VKNINKTGTILSSMYDSYKYNNYIDWNYVGYNIFGFFIAPHHRIIDISLKIKP